LTGFNRSQDAYGHGAWPPNPLTRAKRRCNGSVRYKIGDTTKKFSWQGRTPAWLTLGSANRHGLVTGATGTGKTVSLQVMGKDLRAPGVPVFAPISRETSRASRSWACRRILSSSGPAIWGLPSSRPVFDDFWTYSRAGPSGARQGPRKWGRCCCPHDGSERRPGRRAEPSAFKVADEQGLLLLDMKDLRAILVLYRRTRRRSDHANTAMYRNRRSEPFSASSWCGKTRARTSFRRTGLGAEGFHAHRQRWPGHGQYPVATN